MPHRYTLAASAVLAPEAFLIVHAPDSTLAALTAQMLAPPAQVLKRDQRSFVWATPADAHGRQWVIKRFEHADLKQLLALVVGQHPAQRERRRHRWLARQGVAVAEVAHVGVVRPCRVWLATPWIGQSLCSMIERGTLAASGAPWDWPQRKALIDAVAKLVAPLLDARIFNRDLKTSNIVLDAQGQAWLIDAGAARPARQPEHLPRMLAMLDHTAQRDGATRTDRYRCLRRIAHHARAHSAGPRQLARDVAGQRRQMGR